VASQTAAGPGAPRLVGNASVLVHATPNGVVVDRGLDVRCPAGGPGCTITGTWSVSDYAGNAHAGARFSQRIRPGTQHAVAFPLTAEAAGLLRSHKQLITDVTYTARGHRDQAVAQTFTFNLTR